MWPRHGCGAKSRNARRLPPTSSPRRPPSARSPSLCACESITPACLPPSPEAPRTKPRSSSPTPPPSVMGLPAASLPPSLASVYESRLRLEGVLALAVSQSGRSPDIVAMQAAARRGGALTVALVIWRAPPWRAASEEALPLLAGPEEAVAGDQIAGRRHRRWASSSSPSWHEDGPLLEVSLPPARDVGACAQA